MPTTSTPTTPTDHEPAAFAWTNLWFLIAAHLTAAFAIVYMATIHFSWWTLGFRNQLRQGQAEIEGGRLALAPLLGRLPVALLATG